MRFWCCVFLLLLVMAGSPQAAGKPVAERRNQPIQLKSDQLATDSANRTATFTGNVVARQGDLTIYCDRLVVYYAVNGREVDRVEASGNVRILQGENRGEAGRAVYDQKKGQVTLEQNPRVFQGENVVSGKVVTYYLDEQKSVVSGGDGQRVEAVIQPKAKPGRGDTPK